MFFTTLVSHHCHKELHVNALQRYAAAAYRDGLDLPTIKDLASLASWGRHQGNVERDLHRMIPSLYGTEIATHSTCIEFYNPDTARIEEREIQVLLASDILHALFDEGLPKALGNHYWMHP